MAAGWTLAIVWAVTLTVFLLSMPVMKTCKRCSCESSRSVTLQIYANSTVFTRARNRTDKIDGGITSNNRTIRKSPSPSSPNQNATTGSTAQRPSFSRAIHNVLFSNLSNEQLEKSMLHTLVDFVLLPPKVPINASCRPPPLPSPQAVDCGRFPNVFSGRMNPPAKIAAFTLFGFEVDVFEIFLHEVGDIVDKVVVVESAYTHRRTLKKPLVWDRLQHTSRFAPFRDKVLYFILDDSDASPFVGKPGVFTMESAQILLGFRKFMAWNEETKYFGPTDILMSGHSDEIPRRESLNMLQHCKMTASPANGALWFAFGKVTRAFRTDWPASARYPYSLSVPTFYHMSHAISMKNPTHILGLRDRNVLGGLHMSSYGYLPNYLLKQVTGSEYNGLHFTVPYMQRGDFRGLEVTLDEQAYSVDLQRRCVPVSQIMHSHAEIYYVPWLLRCNPWRFPRAYGYPDPRTSS
eukprot:RCo011379